MQVRPAEKKDLNDVCAAYEASRAYMASHGNETQWPGDYPGLRDAKIDLRRGTLFVCVDEKDAVLGCFTFEPGPEPDYRLIEGGAWLNKFPYFVIHRMATLRQGEGVGGAMVDWVCKAANNVRTDTHENNAAMQALLESRGFERCGVVTLRKAGERVAYHFQRPDDRPEVKSGDPFWFWKR